MRRPFFFRQRSDRADPSPGGEKRPIDPRLHGKVVAFLRDWIPEAAQATYRQMIREDPEHWAEDPHFQGGIIVRFALRGNGITEQVLGVDDLELYWADLLREAVMEGERVPRLPDDPSPHPDRATG